MSPSEAPKTVMQRILDVVERVGNMVPHPVIIFLTLIAIVVVLSHILYMTGASVSTQVIVPHAPTGEDTAPAEKDGYDAEAYDTGTSVIYEAMNEKNYHVETRTIAARSLLTSE